MAYPQTTVETLQEKLLTALNNGGSTGSDILHATQITPGVLAQLSRDSRMWNTVSLNQLGSIVRILVPGHRLNAQSVIEAEPKKRGKKS